MTWQWTPYFYPLLVSASVSLLLAHFVWRRRTAVGAKPLTLFMLAAAGWSFGYALELGSVELATKLFWAKAQYLGIVVVSPLMLLLVLEYTGHKRWVSPGLVATMAAVPALTLVLVWTNEAHHLIWAEVQLLDGGSFSILDLTYGSGFWLHVLVSYGYLMWGSLLLLHTFYRSTAVYRAQVGVMLVGTSAPWLGNVLYVSGQSPFPYLDLTPFAFTLTGLAATLGLFRYRLLDIVPIAREKVLEGMGDSVIVLDGENRIVDLNPAAERMLNRPPKTVLGQLAGDVFSAWPDLVERYRDIEQVREVLPIGNGATQRWYELQISSLTNRAGQQAGRVIVLRDITERKQVEAERERLIAELDAYAHTVAHDLKNPLTAVTGYVSLLARLCDPAQEEQSQFFLQRIQDGTIRMQTIIESLLLLATVRSQEQVRIISLDMGYIVADVLERLDHLIREYQAEIILPESWPPAVGYAPWLEEVWANYLSNAIKYGGRPPRIELGSTIQADQTVCFWVRDNGQGLSPAEQQQLFVPFKQLNRQPAIGHGLGLSIVQRIVEKLNGRVAVESDPGQGSVFSFTLPAPQAEATAEEDDRIDNLLRGVGRLTVAQDQLLSEIGSTREKNRVTTP